MITVIFDDCNGFSQDSYDYALDTLQLHRTTCTCGKSGCLIRYGHYERSVKFLSELILLTVQRVQCKECGRSHALLPSILVPYSQIPLRDQQQIIDAVENGQSPVPVMEKNLLIDENNVKHILRKFRKHWQQRLRSMALHILDDLTAPSLREYLMQFMQIRHTPNKICSATNTA